MSEPLKLHELPPSPNNQKVRIGLGYKKLPYERHPLSLDGYPGDRSQLVAISTQPLTPVLVHGDRVMFDSGAILRYLDANFPDTPRLFSSDFQTMKTIEKWEWAARAEISGPIGTAFAQAGSPEPNLDDCVKASALLHELTGPLEAQLAKTGFLAGDTLSAADVTAAPYIWYSMLPEEAATNPFRRFFHENLKLGDGRDRTRAWVVKVLEHDPDFGS